MNTEQDVNIYFKNKRDQYVVEIRKKKNDDFIQKKRRKLADGSYGKDDPNDLIPQQTQLEALQQFTELASSFSDALKDNNYEQVTAVANLIRRAISNTENPPLDILITTGVVPKIIKLIDYEFWGNEQLLIECAWILANIASGKPIHVQYLVELDIATQTLSLLDHNSEDVKDNAIWILANIAGDSIEYRDVLINLGIVLKLEAMLDGASYHPSFLAHVSWLISNLCRGKPYPDFSNIEPLLKVIQFFVTQIDHEEVLNNSMWTLSYFSDGGDDQIKAVLDLELTSYIINLTSSGEPHMRAPALRTVGNLLTGRDDLTDIMIKNGVIPALSQRLDDDKKLFRKEACWCLSNILAGSPHQIEQIFNYNNREILRKLSNMVYHDDSDVARECIFCLTNPCSEGTVQHIQILVDLNIIELLVETLKSNADAALVKICLEAIEHILSNEKQAFIPSDGKHNPYVIKLAQCGGFVVIEALQSHPDNDVYQVVARIIEKHLDYELA